MNTIYDGSFVLGQTSATNFIAGPGITIDSPSAGTVRIGNDETVLFENSAGLTAFAVSEPLSSFDYLLISGKNNRDFYTMGYYVPNNGFRFGCVQWTYSNDANPLQIFGAYFTSNDGINYAPQGGHQIYFTKTGYTIGGGGTKTDFPIYKVIGINRVSGGNE